MEKQYTEKIQEITINMQTNAMKYKIAILEKIEKRNHQVLSFYVGEIPITNIISGLKRETWTVDGFFVIKQEKQLTFDCIVFTGNLGPYVLMVSYWLMVSW